MFYYEGNARNILLDVNKSSKFMPSVNYVVFLAIYILAKL